MSVGFGMGVIFRRVLVGSDDFHRVDVMLEDRSALLLAYHTSDHVAAEHKFPFVLRDMSSAPCWLALT